MIRYLWVSKNNVGYKSDTLLHIESKQNCIRVQTRKEFLPHHSIKQRTFHCCGKQEDLFPDLFLLTLASPSRCHPISVCVLAPLQPIAVGHRSVKPAVISWMRHRMLIVLCFSPPIRIESVISWSTAAAWQRLGKFPHRRPVMVMWHHAHFLYRLPAVVKKTKKNKETPNITSVLNKIWPSDVAQPLFFFFFKSISPYDHLLLSDFSSFPHAVAV